MMRLVTAIELRGVDKVSDVYRRIGANTKRLEFGTAKAFGHMKKSAVSYVKLVGSIVSAKVLSRGMALIEYGAIDAGRAIVEMDQALTNASAKFPAQVKRGTKEFKEMEKVVMDVGGATKFTNAELGKAMEFMAMAGWTRKDSQASLGTIANFSSATNMEVGRGSDVLTDFLGAFGLNRTDSPEDLKKNVEHAADVLTEAVNTRNVTMENLYDSMRQSGAAVKAGGGNIEEFAGLAATMGGSGIKGTTAATAMKNIYARIAAGKDKGVFSSFGIKTSVMKNGKREIRGMVDILEDLERATRNIGSKGRLKAFNEAFGMRGMQGAAVLVEAIKGGSLRKYVEGMYKVDGVAKRTAEHMNKGLENQLLLMKSASTNKFQEVFNGLMGGKDIGDSMAKFTKAIRDIDAQKVADGLKEVWRWVKPILGAIMKLGPEIKFIATVWAGGKLLSFTGGILNDLHTLSTMLDNISSSSTSVAAGFNAMAKSHGKFQAVLTTGGAVIGAAGLGVAIGLYITDAIERADKKKLDRENKKVLDQRDIAFGKHSERDLVKKRAMLLKQAGVSESDYSILSAGGSVMTRDEQTRAMYTGLPGKDQILKDRLQNVSTLLEELDYQIGEKRRAGDRLDLSNRQAWDTDFGVSQMPGAGLDSAINKMNDRLSKKPEMTLYIKNQSVQSPDQVYVASEDIDLDLDYASIGGE